MCFPLIPHHADLFQSAINQFHTFAGEMMSQVPFDGEQLTEEDNNLVPWVDGQKVSV